MYIAIISKNKLLFEVLQQLGLPDEIRHYNKIEQIYPDLLSGKQIITIIDNDNSLAAIKKFIDHYCALCKVICIENRLNEAITITKPIDLRILSNLILNNPLNIVKVEDNLFHNKERRVAVRINQDFSTEIIELTEKENDLLSYITTFKDYNKEALLKDVFGYVDADSTNTLETHLFRLNAKLREQQSMNKNN